MGMYDVVLVPCPSCGDKYPAQSKGGFCRLDEFELHATPASVLSDVNRHAPFVCLKCDQGFRVHLVVIPSVVPT